MICKEGFCSNQKCFTGNLWGSQFDMPLSRKKFRSDLCQKNNNSCSFGGLFGLCLYFCIQTMNKSTAFRRRLYLIQPFQPHFTQTQKAIWLESVVRIFFMAVKAFSPPLLKKSTKYMLSTVLETSTVLLSHGDMLLVTNGPYSLQNTRQKSVSGFVMGALTCLSLINH